MECEMVLILDGDGNYVVGIDDDDASERYTADIGNDVSMPKRTIRLTVRVPLPKAIEATVTVPAEPQEAVVTVK